MRNSTVFFISALVLIASSVGCGKSYDNGIYRTGRQWQFQAMFYNAAGEKEDSCVIHMEIGSGGVLSSIMGQRELKYKMVGCCGTELNETTGVDERDNMVFIHPPRSGCFSFAEIPPMPEISLPVNMDASSTTELKITKAEFPNLNGKTIKQKHGPVRKENFMMNDTAIPCVVIEGSNINYTEELGVYKCEYLFNERLGFVKLSYFKPDGEKVILTLVKANFR